MSRSAVAGSLTVRVCQPSSAAAGPSASATGPKPTITSCGTGHRIVTTRPSVTAVSLTRRAKRSATSSPAAAIVSAVEQRRAHDLAVAVELGDQGDRLAVGEQLPQLGRQLGGGDAAGTARRPPAGQAGHERVDLADLQVDAGGRCAPRAAWSASWSSRAPDEERTDPAAAGGDGQRVRAIDARQALGVDDPRHVDPGAGPQAGHDAQRDPVHVAEPTEPPLPAAPAAGHTRGGGVPDRPVRPRTASDRRGHEAGAGLERLRRARHRRGARQPVGGALRGVGPPTGGRGGGDHQHRRPPAAGMGPAARRAHHRSPASGWSCGRSATWPRPTSASAPGSCAPPGSSCGW